MAVNETRSMNADLREGLTDGTVKKLAPNRGGFPNDQSAASTVYNDLASDLYDPSFSYGRQADVANRLTSLLG